MIGNIIGEEFEEWVRDEIGIRQQNQFGGYDSSRTPEQLQYLTNRNAWVKLASSVNILPDTYITSYPKAGNDYMMYQDPIYNTEEWQNTPIEPIKTRKPSGGEAKLKNIFGNESYSNFLGINLAKNAILFNTISSLNKTLSNNRAGITKTSSLWNNTSAYGIGGTDYGIQPPPGIIGVTVDSLNRGSIRKANVTLKAHNKFQFDIIELLYLRLGFTMMLEWGWDKFLNGDGEKEDVKNTVIEDYWFTSNGASQLEMLSFIQEQRVKYSGNYDGFFGKVSNFTWNFNPDGSYDISIDLITVGDVIESLKVNTSLTKEFTLDNTQTLSSLSNFKELENTPIAEAATINSLGYFLFKKIQEITSEKNKGTLINPVDNKINYFSLQYLGKIKTTTRTLKDQREASIEYNPEVVDILSTSQLQYQYYIKFDELLTQLENIIILQVKNNDKGIPQIQFEKSRVNISYYPNQISLDPKICLFKPSLNYGDISGINDPSNNFLSKLATYIIEDNGYFYGSLMDMYINFDFISRLIKNVDSSQTLSLYKFLQDLCNGINSALGGVNKLEPIIKDDYLITIIDQTKQNFNNQNSNNPENITVLEVYAYNKANSTSNFVKDIKFQSKITPQLASMISIGATAAGSSISEIDGTAFSKWSEGLEDRFTKEIVEPNGLDLIPTGSLDINAYKSKFENYKDSLYVQFRKTWLNFRKSLFESNPNPQDSKIYDPNFANKQLERLEKKVIKDGNYPHINGKELSFDEFYKHASNYDSLQIKLNNFTPEQIEERVSTNYAIYLLKAFGGSSDKIKVRYPNNPEGKELANINSLQYYKFDDTFISQGKSAYKAYINTLNNTRFKNEGTPSGEVGFIPLSFDLILDGISGIKIYNKLNINNEFLPSNYPESLNFIITKVNHRIENNNWDTSLSTISMPKTKPYKFNSVSNQTESFNPTGPRPDNNKEFIIKDNRKGGKIIDLDILLNELNPIAQSSFRKFFEILQRDYKGYQALINNVRRTWEDSYNLKKEDDRNAKPGRSLHSYGLAIDMNIKTPEGQTLLKANKQPWLNEKIDKVAKDSGLGWGGDIQGYTDCVHFNYFYNVDEAYQKTLTQAKEFGVDITEPLSLESIQNIDALIKFKNIKL